MRTLILIFLASLNFAFAQSIDYDQIVPPDYAEDLSFEDKLVRLAWQNYPSNRIAETRVRQAEADITEKKMGWLDPITFQFYYGEPHINPNFDPTFFPRYNVGVALNVGALAKNPSKVRKAREEMNIAMDNVNAQKVHVRAMVLRRYFEYERRLERLKVHSQRYDDAYTGYLSLTTKFQNGEVSLEEYNRSLLILNDALEKKVDSEGFLKIARADVEEMIGVPLDAVE